MNPSVPGPRVYRLAAERRFREIPNAVKSHPVDVLWTNGVGETALHILCRSRHLGEPDHRRAVESIVEEDPSLLAQLAGGVGCRWTPLMMACDREFLWRSVTLTEVDAAADSLIIHLVKACPKAVLKDYGRRVATPLKLACKNNASLEVLRCMVQAVRLDEAEKYLVTECLLKLWEVQFWTRRPNDDPAFVQDESLSYAKMQLLLQAGFEGKVSDDDDSNVLFAACSLRCPRDYLDKILTRHKDKCSLSHPKTGLLPLHYAIQSANPQNVSAYTSFLIHRLVDLYPDAARVPFSSDDLLLPLHVLIADQRMTWHHGGVEPLALAAPEVLDMPDPRNGLVPALASAMQAYLSLRHLSTTYELLRLAPQVITYGFG